MERDPFGRRDRRTLRELAGLAWERELAAELRLVADHVDQWRAGRIGAHELSDRIHTFHHGAARELYGLYTRGHPSQLVARAVALDLVAESEVPAPLLAQLARSIEFYRSEQLRHAADNSDPDDTEGQVDIDAPAS
jgi:hypothetical protein